MKDWTWIIGALGFLGGVIAAMFSRKGVRWVQDVKRKIP